MTVSISRPDILTITDDRHDQTFFGGNQGWYADEWPRRAGCGPTSAANVLAYLAFTRPGLRSLYGYEEMRRENFTRHMEEVFRFVTPGAMGLHRAEMYRDGVLDFSASRGVSLRPHIFKVEGNRARGRADVGALAEFVRQGLLADCPVGFLNLTRGKVKNLQGWHWLTVTAAELGQGGITVTVSDEGQKIEIDLRLWYLTTRMSGGLVYFTA